MINIRSARYLTRNHQLESLFRLRSTIFSLSSSSSKNNTINQKDEPSVDSTALPYEYKIPIISKRPLKKNQFDEKSLSFLETFNLVTKDRAHTITITCDKVISLINMGAINKNIALQYCHYLIKLAREMPLDDDKVYYLERIDKLIAILLNRDINIASKCLLLTETCTLSHDMCRTSCERAMENTEIRDNMNLGQFGALVRSCHSFQLWELANQIIDKRPDNKQRFSPHEIISFSQALETASSQYQSNDPSNMESKSKLKEQLIDHLYKICEDAIKFNTNFEVTSKDSFIDSMRRLGYNVQVNPTIRRSGLCTHCQTKLPLFNKENLMILHSEIKSLLSTKYDDDHYENASPGEISRFENYIDSLNAKHKIDCVLDGLNIALRHGDSYRIKSIVQNNIKRAVKRQNPASSSVQLINSIIRCHIRENFKGILMIGKDHMHSWPGVIEFLKQNDIIFFLSNDNSRDDMFILYGATLNFGTKLISCDLFRDHGSRLKDQNRIIFDQWLSTHQVWIEKSTLKPLWPTPVLKVPTLDRKSRRIHIPIVDRTKWDIYLANEGIPAYSSNKVLSWICCSPASNNDNDNDNQRGTQ